MDDSHRPLTPFELKIYRRAGLTDAEAQTWADAGITPYLAESFGDAGLDFAQALEWTSPGSGNRGCPSNRAPRQRRELMRSVPGLGPPTADTPRRSEIPPPLAGAWPSPAAAPPASLGDPFDLGGSMSGVQ